MTWVRRFKRNGLSPNAKKHRQQIAQWHVMDTRALVDAVTRVVADVLGRDSVQGEIEHVDVRFGPELIRVLVIEAREKRIVNLQYQSGVDNGDVLLVHGSRNRLEEFQPRGVISIAA